MDVGKIMNDKITEKQQGYLAVLMKDWPSTHIKFFHGDIPAKRLTKTQASTLIDQIKEGATQEDVEGWLKQIKIDKQAGDKGKAE